MVSSTEKKKCCFIKVASCVLCDCSGSHVPGDASVITSPPPTVDNECSDCLRDMAGLIKGPPPNAQALLPQKMYENLN